jgi:vacuolar-type H+-ATPase subunit H
VNEERVQQILDIESQAQDLYQQAVHQAEELPDQAEQEAQELIEKARQDAQAQAKQLVDEAQARDACDNLIHQAQVEAERMENLARGHLDRAVGYVLDRLAGKD